jgi:hypothetical protein
VKLASFINTALQCAVLSLTPKLNKNHEDFQNPTVEPIIGSQGFSLCWVLREEEKTSLRLDLGRDEQRYSI